MDLSWDYPPLPGQPLTGFFVKPANGHAGNPTLSPVSLGFLPDRNVHTILLREVSRQAPGPEAYLPTRGFYHTPAESVKCKIRPYLNFREAVNRTCSNEKSGKAKNPEKNWIQLER